MKYELIKKILNSPISILDYLILEHIANNTAKEFVEDENIRIKGQLDFLKLQEFVSDNNKLTLKGKTLLDQLQKEEISTDFYNSLHKNLQEKMISLTGKKQKMLQGKYAFLPNLNDFKLRLNKVMISYNLTNQVKIKKVLLNYVKRCHKYKFDHVQTLNYYLFKEGQSNFANDYDNFNEIEKEETNDFTGINI